MQSLSLLIQSRLVIVILAMTAVTIILATIAILAFLKIKKLDKKTKLLFSGKSGESLEGIILKQIKEIKGLDNEIQELYEISNRIHQLASRGLHNVGLVRFNPFKDIGGDQSFAIALLNGKKTGLVISSLHTRESTRMYVKPIIHGDSEKYPLTSEEKEAISQAIKNDDGKK